MDYVIGGNVMLDSVRFSDGSAHTRESIGGPATFAYSGVKLFTDSVLQCSRVGADYHGLFDPWIARNGIETKGLKVVCEQSNHTRLVYLPDGTYDADPDAAEPDESQFIMSEKQQDFGYMKTSPEDIGAFTGQGGVKGVYIAQNSDRIFWDRLGALRERDGFKLMWEIEETSARHHLLDRALHALQYVDIFSINLVEAQGLFGVEGEGACIEALQKLPVALTLFRVGKKGLYSVTSERAYFLPSAPVDREVDPTGCGNTSTGAALFAYAEGYDPLMVGIMANCASAQNIRQFGVIPDFAAVREEAWAQARELYEQYRRQFGL